MAARVTRGAAGTAAAVQPAQTRAATNRKTTRRAPCRWDLRGRRRDLSPLRRAHAPARRHHRPDSGCPLPSSPRRAQRATRSSSAPRPALLQDPRRPTATANRDLLPAATVRGALNTETPSPVPATCRSAEPHADTGSLLKPSVKAALRGADEGRSGGLTSAWGKSGGRPSRAHPDQITYAPSTKSFDRYASTATLPVSSFTRSPRQLRARAATPAGYAKRGSACERFP